MTTHDEDVVHITLETGTRIRVPVSQAHLYAAKSASPAAAEQLAPDEANQEPKIQTPEIVSAPAKSADKAAWVKWAVEHHDARFNEAKAMTKADLIKLYGQPPADGAPDENEGDTPDESDQE